MIKNCEMTAQSLPSDTELTEKLDTVCPVAWAKQVALTAHKSACGKGTMCRDGIYQLYLIISDIAQGKGRAEDLALLKELCATIVTAADCLLSCRAAELIARSLELYDEDWNAHISRRRCAAMVCPAFYTVHMDAAVCTGCGACTAVCPKGAIAGGEGLIHVVDNALCSRCSLCFSACPVGAPMKAGALKPRCPDAPVPVGSFGAATAVRRRRR